MAAHKLITLGEAALYTVLECQRMAYLCVVFYRVGISEKASLPFHILDHEATAGGAVLSLALPREGIIWLSVYTIHFDNCIEEPALQECERERLNKQT